MTKKDLRLTIEEDLLQEAKKHIPNLSAFVEHCLKSYLGYGDTPVFPTKQAQEELDKIKEAQLNLYLLSDMKHLEEKQREEHIKEINKNWRILVNQYIDTFTLDEDSISDLSKLTGEPIKTIEDMIDYCYVNQGINYNDFNTVKEMVIQ